MIRYNIHINTGDDNHEDTYYFCYHDLNITKEESDRMFDQAVKELDHIYKDYGRFATSTGVTKLFEKFGFVRTVK